MKKAYKILSLLLLAVMFVFGSCGNKSQEASTLYDSIIDSSDVKDSTKEYVQDSTLYGTATDCGQSTFNLILENGDTVFTSRMSPSGKYGEIYGDLNLDDRFCMIATDKNQTLVSAINLTQLEKFVKQYTIINGRLYLPLHSGSKPEMVKIVDLTDDSLVVKTPSGVKTYR